MKRTPKKPADEKMRQWCRWTMRGGLNSNFGAMRQDQFNQELIAEVDSDRPLSRDTRNLIARELRRFYSSPSNTPPGPDFDEWQIRFAAMLKHMLQHCGLTATEAEQDVAEELRISVDALRKRFQRELDPSFKAELNFEKKQRTRTGDE